MHYPPNASGSEEFRASDLPHLEPMEFLNDTAIDFYLRYILVGHSSPDASG